MLDNTLVEPEQAESKQTPPPPRFSGFRFVMFLVFALAACALAFLIYNGITARVRAESTLRQETGQMAIPTVSIVHPKLSDAAEEIVLPGNIQAFTDSPIYARTNGYLKKWYVDIGARVKAGQPLADIETPEIDQQLQQVRADLATAKANLALAQSTATRYQFLLKTDSVSQQETDDKTGDLNAKKAIVDSAEATVRRLEQTQGFQKLYAPFDGVITARNTDIGALIDSGANSPGKELFHEASTGTLRVFVNVPQVYSHAARVGSTADLTFNEFPGRRFRGTLSRTTEAIDPASRTLLTEIEVNNATGELFPGAYTSVHLKLPSKVRALTVPVNTLLFRSEGLRVAVVRNGHAQLVPFTMGRDFGSEVEVMNGLHPADAVIVNPADSLTTGMEVHAASGGAE
jgi:RND family efflux transporter MFP subunit